MKRIFSILITVLSLLNPASGQDAAALYEGFQNPRKDCYPRVWWHWMYGNVTKDGIKKDLEWMHRVGIAGVHQFNAQLMPEDVIVDERVPIFSERWKEMFRYALEVSDSLGMEYTIPSSPGWSITGGPWVSMEDAQKKLCWKTMKIRGGRRIRENLPNPYRFSGPLQEKPQYPNDIDKYLFYKDIAVLAIRTSAIEKADTIDQWQKRTGFYTDLNVNSNTPALEIKNFVPKEAIIDISRYCSEGKINWKAPKGEWTIYRFGYNLIGRQNGPVEKDGKGLEADKLSHRAMSNYYHDYLKLMDEASGHRLGKSVKYMLIDSYEAGKGTWTDLMCEEFRNRRGYDIIPWLPVLIGIPVGSMGETADFLFDWRITLGEMIAEYHYKLAAETAAEYGMGLYCESHEWKTAFVGDGMMPKKYSNIPMGAMWVRYGEGLYGHDLMSKADIRESASVAHIYGQNIVGAESFTVDSGHKYWGRYPAYQCHPGMLKRLADAAFSQGLNRFILHCSPHQPRDDKFPGLGLGYYGNWFTRHDTWAEESKPWYDYLARNCYLMQQGRFAADVAVFYGEDRNVTGLYAKKPVPAPEGYGYDLVNADIILHELTAEGGKLRTRTGMCYSMLLIDPQVNYISEEVSRKIEEFRVAGVLVCHKENASEMLRDAGIEKDCRIPQIKGSDFQFIHRILDCGHIYRIANVSPLEAEVEISLRVSGLKPMLWNAEDGSMKEVSYNIENGRTTVYLHFNPDESHIIVLAEKADSPSLDLCLWDESASTEIEEPWEVRFQKDRGAPEKATFNMLVSYTDTVLEGIQHFSGTAEYNTEFEFSKKSDADAIILDLGEVGVMARVYLNGKDLGLLWHAPYRVDVTKYLIKGKNSLKIAVTNLWANRLIGDSALPKNERISYTAYKFYKPSDPLVRSGLMGPVKLIEYEF